MVKKRNYIFGTEEGTQGPEFNVFEKVGLGAASGGLKIVEGIAELGAGFIDYAADTDLVTALEENYWKINVTDGVGKFVEIALQYGVPYTGALKIGSKLGAMKKMRDLGSATKVGAASRIAGKMGYYGAPAIVADSITGSARDATLGEAFGLYKDYDSAVEGKEGRQKASEVLKQKLLTGIEGGVLGGLISTAAGPAIKGTFKLGAKGASLTGRALSPTIINPLQNLIARQGTGTTVGKVLKSIKDAKQKIAPLSLRQMRFMQKEAINVGNKIRAVLGKYITPEGTMSREARARVGSVDDAMKAVRSDLNFYIPELTKQVKLVSQKIKAAGQRNGKNLTRDESILADVNRVLSKDSAQDGALNLNSFRKIYFDKGLRGEELDNLVNAVKNLDVMRSKTVRAVLAAFRPAQLKGAAKEKAKAEVKDIVNNLLARDTESYFRAFDKNVTFRFEGKDFGKKLSAAKKEALDVLIDQRNKTGKVIKEGINDDAVLKIEADSQIDKLVRLAEAQGSEGSFFHTLRNMKDIPGGSEGLSKYYSTISKDMIYARGFGEGKYALKLRNLLGYEFNPLKGFENKYMAVASQLGQKRYINSLQNYNKQLGVVEKGRMEKFMFEPTKSTDDLMKEGLDPSMIQSQKVENVRRQIADEYNIPLDKVQTPVNFNPAKLGGSKKVDDDVYGIFDGITSQKGGQDIYLTPQMSESLMGMSNITDGLLNAPFYKSFLKAKAGTQIGKTILSPVTQIRNFTSAAFFALHNGHFGNPFGIKSNFSIADVLKTHVDELFPNGVVGKDGLQKLAQEAKRKLELGVTSGSVIQGEIDDIIKDVARKGSSYDTTDGLFNAIYNNPKFKNVRGNAESIGELARAGYKRANQFYSKGDDFWKDYGYRFTMSQLNEAIPDINSINVATGAKYTQENIAKLIETAHLQLFKRRPNIFKEGVERGLLKEDTAKGIYKTRKELMEEFSAEYVKNTYPNYSYVSQAVRELRRLPFGNFISFPAEMMRTSGNLMTLTARELAISTGDAAMDAVFRQMGSRRLIGQMAGFSTGPLLATYSMKMLGMSEEQYAALQESQVAEWNQYSDLIMLGKEKDKQGNVKYKYINYAYQNPYDYIRKPFYNFFGEFNAQGKQGKDFEDRMWNATTKGLGAMFSPFIDEAILSEKILDIYRGNTKTGRRIWDANVDNFGDKLVYGLSHILKGVSPGVFTQAGNVASALAEETTPYGKQYDLPDELIALMSGVRVYESDIGNNLNFTLSAYLNEVRTHKSRAGKQIFAANVNSNTVTSAYKEYVEDSFRSYNKIKKNLNDAEILGIEKRHINKLFKERKVKKEIRYTLQRGTFQPPKWRTFFKDQRLKKIARERGIPLVTLFNFRDLITIESEYRNMELLQSIDDVRKNIKVKRKEREVVSRQGQGTTVNNLPINSVATRQPVAGTTPPQNTLRQRLLDDDDGILKGIKVT